jgi:hypothetical protein
MLRVDLEVELALVAHPKDHDTRRRSNNEARDA